MIKITEADGKIEDIVIGERYDSVEIPLHKRNSDEMIDGELMYPIKLLPKKGRYSLTTYQIDFELRDVDVELDRNVKNKVSICDFFVKAVEKDRYKRLYLQNDSNQTPGFITDRSGFLSEGLKDGEECFVTVKIQYPHEKMLEQYSEEKIKSLRERFKKNVEEIREMAR